MVMKASKVTIERGRQGKVAVSTEAEFESPAGTERITLGVLLSIAPDATINDVQRMALRRAAELLTKLAAE